MGQPEQERSNEQVARERAAAEVSDVLLNIEYALTRARKARTLVESDGVDVNARLALGDAIGDLEQVRKRLIQDTYYSADPRLG